MLMLLRQPSFVESAPLQSPLNQLAGIIDASTHISQFNKCFDEIAKWKEIWSNCSKIPNLSVLLQISLFVNLCDQKASNPIENP